MRFPVFVVALAGCSGSDSAVKRAQDTAVAPGGNLPPSCSITSPESGGQSWFGDAVSFEAVVADSDAALGALTVTWSSDIDGVLATGATDADQRAALTTDSLSAGNHAIELQAHDDGGASCTDSISYTVQDTAPSIESVTIGPHPAREGDTLICEYTGFYSPKALPDMSTIQWRVNAVDLDVTDGVLSEGFAGDDTVTCTVTPADGAATGTPQSDSVLIEPLPLYDLTPAWPLCGRITDDPPSGWTEADGCPRDRWNSLEHTDYPINSTFGPRQLRSGDYRYDYHRGIDLSADIGTPIFAVAPGEVVKAGEYASYADPIVQVRHFRPGSDGRCADEGCWHTNHLHLSSWSVTVGETVERGQLLGHTGASASGYPHLHFEIRDARPEDPYSAWQHDTVHPLSVLPYPDGSSEPELTIESIDASVWSAPIVDLLVAFRAPEPELDMIRAEVRVYTLDMAGEPTEIPQPVDTPWFVDPPFFDVDQWNRQYTHKNSSDVPWSSFSDCPHADQHADSYDAHVHMDRADPSDPQVGLFNGVRVAPNFYNQSTAEWLLELRFFGLVVPEEAARVRFVAELTDARGNVLVSEPVDVSAP